ncbi:deaminase-reductase domain-containing protein [Mycolicibacterium conceptionense]|uniref:Deaminase-reductase domain-containing protein n=1 Tax=Mycolicibacterium conceptionense TaxID=451644 RepID=A0A0U1DB58_9MYCO|nr:deaminase-reductase domain-containing protein [Mycolicibacterium conceptionense]
MGLIEIELFATLDLVAQAPGGPDEDPEGFSFGGWQAPLIDEVSGAQVGASYQAPTPFCSAGAPTTSSPPTGRIRPTSSARCSTASPSTSRPAARLTCRGPVPHSSARIWVLPCVRSEIGMNM